jgi:RHS repeat-associated protein
LRTDVPLPNSQSTNAQFTAFSYTGQRGLEASGLMDYKARFYDPVLGRFIQPDTIIPGVGNSQAYNRYAYVLNSPVNFNDPTGHRQECDSNDRNCDGKDDDSRFFLTKHPGVDKYQGSDHCKNNPDCESPSKSKFVGAFYVGDNVPRNLTEHEAEVYTAGASNGVEAAGDFVGAVDDFTNIAKTMRTKTSNIFVYAIGNQYANGSVNLTGVTIYNQSDYRIFLYHVEIRSKKDFLYGMASQTCTLDQCYSPNPPVIKAGGPNSGYFATIDAGQSKTVFLTPSGAPLNPNNQFGSESLTADATLYFIYQPYPSYKAFNIPIK